MNLMKKIKHWLSRKNLACEIKLLLDSSQVLGADHQLMKSMQKAFQIEDEPMRIEVIYLDTPERDYLKAGWVSRIRVKEGKPRYTITYKMRYPVPEGDVDAALAAARADGLTLKESPYPAEIDWGYSKMTLSFAASMQTETSLSFLGFGVYYPQPSWGNMLSRASNAVAAINFWWQWVFTSAILIMTTVCINTIGDTLRDVMDPKSTNDK